MTEEQRCNDVLGNATCLSAIRHDVSRRHLLLTGVTCLGAGIAVGWNLPTLGGSQSALGQTETVIQTLNEQSTPLELIEVYQAEVLRLTRLHLTDHDQLREKQLLLNEMNRRGITQDSSVSRRLQREVASFKRGMERTQVELERLQSQLANLADVQGSNERKHYGIDMPTEVDARRVIMEYNAGILPRQPRRGTQ